MNFQTTFVTEPKNQSRPTLMKKISTLNKFKNSFVAITLTMSWANPFRYILNSSGLSQNNLKVIL